jgi:fatty-acyl-CoA synthase
MDKDGYFWLTGRKKEIIIRGGHNIDPAVIEEPIYRMPQVKAAAAVGRPDAHSGEVPVAYVELREGQSLTPQQILEFAAREIPERAAVPKEVYIVDKLPLTPIGKIHKPTLVWDAARRVYEKEMEAVSDLASSVTVAVAEDRTSGKVAVITVTPRPGVTADTVKKRIDDILAHYTLKYEIVVA